MRVSKMRCARGCVTDLTKKVPGHLEKVARNVVK